MRVSKSMLLTVFSAALLFGCAGNQAALEKSGAKQMTGSELKERYSKERNASWTNVRGSSGTATRRPDGTALVDWGSGSDTGTWRIVGDTLCSKWQTAREGKEYCLTVFKVDDGQLKWFEADGSYLATSRDR